MTSSAKPKSPSPCETTIANVLVVEDEATTRRALTWLLLHSGYCAQAVETAEDALALIKSGNHPAIALIDADLPGMSGFDLIRHLQKHEPDVAPVLVTAADSARLDAFSQKTNVPYLRKPIIFEDLLTILSRRQRAD